MFERPNTVRLAFMGSLCLVTTLVYGKTLSDYFLSDDLSFLWYAADRSQKGHLLVDLLSDFLSPPDRVSFFYRPLVDVFFTGDYLLWGVHPLGWRLTNLVLHLVNTLLVWGIIEQVVGRVPRCSAFVVAGSAAAVFALRPSSPETVAWLSGRSDSLAFLGMLIALLGYLRAKGQWGWWYVVAIGGFLFALGSKEAGVTLPGGLVALHLAGAIELTPAPGEPRWRAWVRQTIIGVGPFAFVLVAYFAWRAFLFGTPFEVYQNTPPITLTDLTWWAAKLHALWFFLAPSLVWTSLTTWVAVVIVALGLVGLVCAWWSPAVRRVWVFGACWLMATLLPLAQQLSIAPTGEGMRLLYIPGAALAVMITSPLAMWSSSGKPGCRLARYVTVAGGIGILLVIVLSIPLLAALLKPWHEAGQNMRAVRTAIAARAEAVPEGHLAMLLLPDHIEGALFGRNCQGALMEPPVQERSLSGRVLVVTPSSLRDHAPRLAIPSPSIQQVEHWCWDVTARRFEQLNISPHSPETWLDAWRPAVRNSNCRKLADELEERQR
jgi:hypothetical protein